VDERELDVQGRWWLPGQDYEDGIPGTLRFDPTDGGSLILNGHLKQQEEFGVSTIEGDTTTTTFSEKSMTAAGTYDFILGQAENKAFTLRDSFQSSSNRVFGGRDSREVITVNQIYRGGWFGPPGPMEFDRALVGMRHLVQWVNPGQITGKRSFAKSGEWSRWELAGEWTKATDGITTADGFSIDLIRTLSQGGDRLATFTLSQDCRWKISSTAEVEEKMLVERAAWLQDLVSIATGRTAQFLDVTFHHPELEREMPGDVPNRRLDIDYFARWSARDDERPSPPPRDHLFTFDQLDGMEGVGKWLATAEKYRASLGRIGASRYVGGLYVSDMLLHRTAALESFDRVRSQASNSRFRTRFRRCLALAGEDFQPFLGDAEVWLEMVVTARDDAAHQLDPLADDSVDFLIVESLYWLFLICFLKEAGVARPAIDNLVSSQRFGSLSRSVNELTTPV
jgi:hypothetical protein